MDIKDFIYAGLDAGKSFEEILDEVADAANSVMAEQSAQAKNAEKYERAAEVLAVVDQFLVDYYPDICAKTAKWDDMTGQELCEILDELVPSMKALFGFVDAVKPVVKTVEVKKDDADAVISKFLRDLGI